MEKRAKQPESSTDRTSKTMLFVMLGFIVAMIVAFLLLRPRPAGTPPPKNPMKAGISKATSIGV